MGFALTSVLPAWLHRRTVGGAAEQSSRWHSFRRAALSTPYYQKHPIARGGVLELAELYQRHAEFLNPEAETPPPAELTTTWNALPKTLAVNPWFRLQSPVETVLDAAQAGGRKYEALAAPADILATLAARNPALPPPLYGMIAFTGISRPQMSARLRDALWEAWRAPVFEQFRGFQGELLGAECEAFAGLHYDPEMAVWEERDGPGSELLITSLVNLRHPAWRLATRYRGRVEHGVCDCGSYLPRVVWE